MTDLNFRLLISIDKIDKLFKEINSLSFKLIAKNAFISPSLTISGRLYNLSTFKEVVSYFYVLFNECSGDNVYYFRKYLRNEQTHILKIISSFRTIYQHHTSPEFINIDKDKINTTEEYFYDLTTFSSDRDLWEAKTHKLIDDVLIFLNSIKSLLKNKEHSENLDMFVEQWELCIYKKLPPHIAKDIIRKMLMNLNLNYDVVKFYNKILTDWEKYYKSLRPESDILNSFKDFVFNTLNANKIDLFNFDELKLIFPNIETEKLIIILKDIRNLQNVRKYNKDDIISLIREKYELV